MYTSSMMEYKKSPVLVNSVFWTEYNLSDKETYTTQTLTM